jgi:hypothetical protein
MIDDKYIGLGLAVSSSLAIGIVDVSDWHAANWLSGSSFVITKKVPIARYTLGKLLIQGSHKCG